MQDRQPSTSPNVSAEPIDLYDFLRGLLSELGPDNAGTEETTRQIANGMRGHDARFWNQFIRDLDYHGLTLLIEPAVASFKTTPGAIPDDARRAFAALADRHRQMAGLRETCIDRLLTAFADADIEMVLLKGAVLAHRIYPVPELRPMIDIDILIDRAHARAAVEVASKLGYRFESRHPSFGGRSHHLPVAEIVQSGFSIFLEIHIEALHLDQRHRLVLSNLASPPQPFARGSGPAGLALGHTDMLRHLTVHAFVQARRIRLMHLYDLWRYQTIFRDEIDWKRIEADFPYVIVVLRLVSQVFRRIDSGACEASTREPIPAGLGYGMIPLAEIAASDMKPMEKIAALFNPPAWWLHGFYGVPPEQSLFWSRTVRHPLMVARWMLARGAAALGLGDIWNWIETHNRTHRKES